MKLGIRKSQESVVESVSLSGLAHDPYGRMHSEAKYAPSLTLSFGVRVWVSYTHSAPCIALGGQLNEW